METDDSLHLTVEDRLNSFTKLLGTLVCFATEGEVASGSLVVRNTVPLTVNTDAFGAAVHDTARQYNLQVVGDGDQFVVSA